MVNNDLFRYKSYFLTLALLFSYTYLHISITGYYVDTSPDNFINLVVRLPYAQRLLVPTIAHWFQFFFYLPTEQIFFLLEWLFVGLLYFSLKHLLQTEFSDKQAKALAWLFLLFLPLVTAINYRFPFGGRATFYFPNDTPTLFFIAIGYLLCLQKKWVYFIGCVFLATLNRESSILLPLLIPTLYLRQFSHFLKPFIFSLFAYMLGRIIVWLLVGHLPGHFVEFYYALQYTHFHLNMVRLCTGQQLFFFIYCLAGMPLFWFVFYNYIPLRYRPLRYLLLFYFLSLLVVGNFVEARIFGEMVVFLYLPVCVAVKRWLLDEKMDDETGTGILYYLDRYLVIMTFLLVCVLNPFINAGIVWLSHQ